MPMINTNISLAPANKIAKSDGDGDLGKEQSTQNLTLRLNKLQSANPSLFSELTAALKASNAESSPSNSVNQTSGTKPGEVQHRGPQPIASGTDQTMKFQFYGRPVVNPLQARQFNIALGAPYFLGNGALNEQNASSLMQAFNGLSSTGTAQATAPSAPVFKGIDVQA